MGHVEVQHHSFLTLALVVSGQLYTLPALPPVPFEQEAEWAPELVWTFWRRATSLALAGIWTPDGPACNIFTILTTLSWLQKNFIKLVSVSVDTHTL